MIEIFKTNIPAVEDANRMLSLLLEKFPGNKINFDLDDCDKVLRMEGYEFCSQKVISIVNEHGYLCNILD